jgi:hypothetical protein
MEGHRSLQLGRRASALEREFERDHTMRVACMHACDEG